MTTNVSIYQLIFINTSVIKIKQVLEGIIAYNFIHKKSVYSFSIVINIDRTNILILKTLFLYF